MKGMMDMFIILTVCMFHGYVHVSKLIRLNCRLYVNYTQ